MHVSSCGRGLPVKIMYLITASATLLNVMAFMKMQNLCSCHVFVQRHFDSASFLHSPHLKYSKGGMESVN